MLLICDTCGLLQRFLGNHPWVRVQRYNITKAKCPTLSNFVQLCPSLSACFLDNGNLPINVFDAIIDVILNEVLLNILV